MVIYKYGLTQEKLIYKLECPVLEERIGRNGLKMYDIKTNRTNKKWIYENEIEVYNNKVLYSFSPDKMDFYIDCLKSHYARMYEDFIKKSEDVKLGLAEILKINNLE